MSLSGELLFYTESRPRDPRHTLRAILDYLQLEHVLYAYQNTTPDRRWEATMARIRGEDEDDDYADSIDPPQSYKVAGRINVMNASSLLKDDIGLHIKCDQCHTGQDIMLAVQRMISEDVRSLFAPSDVHLGLGWSDIVDAFSGPKPVFLGRAYIKVGFFSYGMPHNPPLCSKMLFELDIVKRVKQELEAICGPLKQTVLYYA